MDILETTTSEATTASTALAEMNKDHAKVLAMLSLGLGCLLIGLLPAILRVSERRRQQFLISNLLCFGAGVLLATSLVHMLPEVREHYPDRAEMIFCSGFFVVYIVDELVHAFCGEAIRHTHHNHVQSVQTPSRHSHQHQQPHRRASPAQYGSTSESQSLLDKTDDSVESPQLLTHSTIIRQVEDAEDEEANARICHTTHTEPCEQSSAGHAGLLLALSIHAVLEGLAIGVQSSAAKVLMLLGAVCVHKFVVGFCLGVELSSTPGSQFKSHFLAIFIFSMGSVSGIGIGMALTDVQDIDNGPALQILQGIAAGTLLYVTVCEVLPREKARWHLSNKRFAGVVQCLSVIVGFLAMSLLTVYYAA